MTPIEAAARAISDAMTETPEHWRDWIHEARAAIAAIREPSNAMRRAEWEAEQNGNDVWTAMHAAALAEGPDA